jgi:hypothetical protein
MKHSVRVLVGSVAIRCAMFLLCTAVGQGIARSAPTIAGTYGIVVSQGSFADPAQPPPRYQGRLVLLSENLSDDTVTALGWNAYGHKAIEGRPNGCFALCTDRSWDGKVLSMPKVERELIHWSVVADGKVSFTLFRTPDWGYAATLTANDAGLVGTADDWGRGTSDDVTARRRGEASMALCQDLGRLTCR